MFLYLIVNMVYKKQVVYYYIIMADSLSHVPDTSVI